jgi:hypothetical protein
MVDRHECDRCHKIFVGELDTISFYKSWWDGIVRYELCRDCSRMARELLVKYLRG